MPRERAVLPDPELVDPDLREIVRVPDDVLGVEIHRAAGPDVGGGRSAHDRRAVDRHGLRAGGEVRDDHVPLPDRDLEGLVRAVVERAVAVAQVAVVVDGIEARVAPVLAGADHALVAGLRDPRHRRLDLGAGAALDARVDVLRAGRSDVFAEADGLRRRRERGTDVASADRGPGVEAEVLHAVVEDALAVLHGGDEVTHEGAAFAVDPESVAARAGVVAQAAPRTRGEDGDVVVEVDVLRESPAVERLAVPDERLLAARHDRAERVVRPGRHGRGRAVSVREEELVRSVVVAVAVGQPELVGDDVDGGQVVLLRPIGAEVVVFVSAETRVDRRPAHSALERQGAPGGDERVDAVRVGAAGDPFDAGVRHAGGPARDGAEGLRRGRRDERAVHGVAEAGDAVAEIGRVVVDELAVQPDPGGADRHRAVVLGAAVVHGAEVEGRVRQRDAGRGGAAPDGRPVEGNRLEVVREVRNDRVDRVGCDDGPGDLVEAPGAVGEPAFVDVDRIEADVPDAGAEDAAVGVRVRPFGHQLDLHAGAGGDARIDVLVAVEPDAVDARVRTGCRRRGSRGKREKENRGFHANHYRRTAA